MDFKLDIGELTNTIRDYENFINILAEQKENINKTVKELIDQGWSGEAKDKFMEIHIKKQEFYTKLIEDIKYEKNALENEEKPRAIQLKKRCEDFENCIKRSAGGAALTNDDTGIISLQYGGQFPINNNVSECTDNYLKKMDSKFVEILNLVNSLTFTSFLIEEDVEKARKSLKDQTTSLTDFKGSFNAYCNGVRDMEENICSVFSKISGITEEISQIRGMQIISENGQVDKNKVMQLMLKNPADLTKEEKEILKYSKIVLGEDDKSIYLKQVGSEKIGIIASIKKEISKGGKLYKYVQLGKAGTSVILGGLTIVGSGALEFFSGGTVTPAAVAGLTFGGNSVANGIHDIYFCYKGEYDKVGNENYLEDGTEMFCGTIGGTFGHKAEGKIVGETAYYAGDLFSSWKGLTKAYDIVTSTNKYMKTIRSAHIESTLTRKGVEIQKKILPAYKLVSNTEKYYGRVKKIYSESIESSYKPILTK